MWINRKDQEPLNHPILVLCTCCQTVHSVIYDYNDWVLAEWCDEDGPRSGGMSVDFVYWMEQPGRPE